MAFVNESTNPGILLTFKLSSPVQRPLAELELHLSWPDGTAGPSAGKADEAAVESAPQHGTVENYLEGLQSNPEMRRQSMEGAQEAFAERARNLNTVKIMQGPLPVQSMNQLPILESAAATRVVKSVFDPVEQQADEAFFDQLCRAYKGEPLPQFPGACAVWDAIEKSRLRTKGPLVSIEWPSEVLIDRAREARQVVVPSIALGSPTAKSFSRTKLVLARFGKSVCPLRRESTHRKCVPAWRKCFRINNVLAPVAQLDRAPAF